MAQPSRPPLEIGVAVGGLFVSQGDWVIAEVNRGPSLDLRFTAPFSSRFSFEAFATFSRDSELPFRRATEGLYGFQIKQRLPRTARTAFITYGVVGVYERVTQSVDPVFTDTAIEQPITPIFGVGVQQTLGRHLAVRADAQLVAIPLGARLSAGLSIPLGTYR